MIFWLTIGCVCAMFFSAGFVIGASWSVRG